MLNSILLEVAEDNMISACSSGLGMCTSAPSCRVFGSATMSTHTTATTFFDLSSPTLDGEVMDFSSLAGGVVLVLNVASK